MKRPNGLWFRHYTDSHRNRKLRKLPAETQLCFWWLCELKRENLLNGGLLVDIAWELHLQVDELQNMISQLQKSRLILDNLEPCGWGERQFESDSSTERTRRYRLRTSQERHGDVPVTVPESREQNTETEEELLIQGGQDRPPQSMNINIKSDKIPYREIISDANEVWGTNFQDSKYARSYIKARWNEGFRLKDFKAVVRDRHSAWGGDPEMMRYLRPRTVWGTKMHDYLANQLKPKSWADQKIAERERGNA